MTPREWYSSRLDLWTRRRDQAAARSVRVSRLRLLTFFGSVAVLWWGAQAHQGPVVLVGVLLMIGFGGLVVHHARVLAAVERAEAARQVARRGMARIERNWRALDDAAPPTGIDLDDHPYARDLDLFGHASLASWLGPAATRDGEARLGGWLLAADPAADIRARQQAIDDLAVRGEWREALGTEGSLARVDPDELIRFMTWAEETTPAIDRIVHTMVLVTTGAIWLLGSLQIVGVLDRSWWLLPATIGIVMSFAFAGRTYAVLDRVSIGQRALGRYALMLGLVCTEKWSAPELIRLHGELRSESDAPRVVNQLSRLVDWSELRTAAPLLHFPIQALTLWDFHVLFAMERWRARYGRLVRRWLDALGHVDALSVLAGVRHDCPDWAFAEVDPSARSLTAAALGHPLIPDDRRVANDVEVGPPGTLLLITGSNMSGKSTLLRAIGLNAVLAQAGAPACAAAFRMPPCDVRSSIRIQDSLELGQSYFMAALARLKSIVDAAEQQKRTGRWLLYLLDEVLQGTNSAERGLAVRAIARHLLDAGAIGVMTTHDLTIAREEPFASRAQLQHFAEQVHEDGRMTFDYRLRSGLATSRNALRLMQLIGIAPQ
jgi:hypothetical protein